MSRRLEFWFEFASTYSYLSALRIGEAARARGVQIVWRPFLLGPIFTAQGWRTSPFNVYPAKGVYMWRDVERRAHTYGLNFRRPSVFPMHTVKAARLALVAGRQGRIGELTETLYRAAFEQDADLSDTDQLAALAAAAGLNPGAVEETDDEAIRTQLRANVSEAMARGVFGAPTFFVGDEMYWGDDRLDEALACLTDASFRRGT